MRKAFVVHVYGNQQRAVRVKVRPYETDKRGVHLLACCRGLLESRLLKDYEDLKEWERIAGEWC
jgi:hypothetical protein